MAHTGSDERGITIIETTVVLTVMFILAGVMSPIVSESVNTARAVKARNDASMIAMGLINLQKDMGADALSFGGAAAGGAALPLPEVLASGGARPEVDEAAETPNMVTAIVPLLFTSGQEPSARMPRAQRRRWREVAAGALDDHLRTNRHGYRYRRPGEYGGWNGPYVSNEVKGDPWGNQYLINARWFDHGTSTAKADGQPRRAVFVLSAGADGIIDTPFEQSIVDAKAYGDDVVVRIQ